MHFKASQFDLQHKKQEVEKMTANSNVVASAIEACKMKTAATSFESLLGLLSFAGTEIGHIGHGR